MAFEREQAFVIESKKMVKSDQFESTSRVEVLAEKPLKKVVSVNAMAKITGKEKVGESLNFTGKTTYQIAYQTQDNLLASALAFVEWSGKLDGMKEENVFLKAKVVANTITDFSETEIAVATLINVDAVAIVKEEIQTVENLPEDYVKLEKNYDYEKVVNFVSDNFSEVAEEETTNIVSDILFANATANISSVVCGIDTVTIEGDIFVRGAYLKDQKVEEFSKSIEYKRELSALSVVPNNIADAVVDVENVLVTASVNETDQKTNLVFSVDLSANVTVYEKNNLLLVQDAFSVSKETENTYECITARNFEGVQTYQETYYASLALPEVCQTFGAVVKTNAEITDKVQAENGTVLSGAVAVETISLDSDGNAVLDRGFTPFSILVPDAESSCEFDLSANLENVKQKAGNEVDLEFVFNVKIKTETKEFVGFVKSIEEKEEKQKSNSAIRVYVTKAGEDIFAVSKAMSIKPETILEQNPAVGEIFEAGTRLIVYSGLNLNF